MSGRLTRLDLYLGAANGTPEHSVEKRHDGYWIVMNIGRIGPFTLAPVGRGQSDL